jgi:hypothetical protein
MLPAFTPSGNLPAGIHLADWAEVVTRFGWTPHRLRLIGGLLRALQNLRTAGCSIAYLDGSFVSSRERPSDFDACWEVGGVNLALVDPVLKTFANGRALQKVKYLGELFPSHVRADRSGSTFLSFFQVDKSTGDSKGIVALRLEGLPL